MADQLTAALSSYLSATQKNSDGLGSFFVATTLEELEAMGGDTRFATSTGIELTPLDLLRLGGARHDFFCAVDDKGFPSSLAAPSAPLPSGKARPRSLRARLHAPRV